MYASKKILGKHPRTGIAKPVALALPFPCEIFFLKLFSKSEHKNFLVVQSYLKGLIILVSVLIYWNKMGIDIPCGPMPSLIISKKCQFCVPEGLSNHVL
jgi:hypothetical protein